LHPQSPQGGNVKQIKKPPFRKKGGFKKNKKHILRFSSSLLERGEPLNPRKGEM
jgi:hypothetical protein